MLNSLEKISEGFQTTDESFDAKFRKEFFKITKTTYEIILTLSHFINLSII